MESILTVVTPATSFDLTTVADVKADLGITGGASDALLTRYISESSVQIARACNRVFGEEELSELFRGRPFPRHGTAPLILSRRPVSEIDSVTEDDVLLSASD